MLIMWILLSLAILFVISLSVGAIRRIIYTRWLYAWFARILPAMSATESAAIDAGDTWYEAKLFQGRANFQQLLAYPKPTLTKEEQDFLDNEVETLCNMLDDWKITHYDLDLPTPVWNYIKTAGFFGMHIPKQYGGLEFSTLASSTVLQKIATKSSTAAVIVMVPNSLGPAELLLNYGTNAQKEQYLHNLAKGVEVPCFGLTSTYAGSDAGSIIDEGVVVVDKFNGQEVLGLRLNWSKRYITLAPIATVIGLAVKVRDPNHLLGDKEELGITVVLMPTTLAGIEIGKRHFPLNTPFMNGPTRGHDVFVPLDFVVGGRERIGQGWQMLVECLAAGRGVSLPAVSTASGKHCFAVCGAYAKLRQQFGLSIGKFEGVASVLSRIGGLTYILEATRVLTLGAIDNKARPSVVTAICKYHMTEMARIIINDAMDIHGGRAIMLGPNNYLARTYEALPISITVEGANILTRCLIIFGQGAIRCHPYVLKEMLAVANPNKVQGLIEFDKAFFGHICYSTANFTKLIWHSLTGLIFCNSINDDKWSRYSKRISYLSLSLACCSDVAMLVLGGNLKRKENISARLGDVLSYLYMASAVLKYNSDNPDKEAEVFVQWALDYCLFNIYKAFDGFFTNFSQQFFAKPLQWLILPFWRNYKMPKDAIDLQMSKIMMQDSELRTSFTKNCVPVKNLEQAFQKMLEVEPLMAIVEQAVKQGKISKHLPKSERINKAFELEIINTAEASLLKEFETMLLDILQVDEFTNTELMRH